MGVAESTRIALETIGKTDTPGGQACMALAARLDSPDCPATALAAIAKEHRATMADLLRDAPAVGDPVDELREKREARRKQQRGA